MKIDELPVEILEKIFSYLLTFKRISLVNRRFYEVACIVNKNVSLTLNRKFFETAKNRPLLQSIEESSRKIKKVKIRLGGLTGENERTIVSLLTKFSETIKSLQLDGSRTDDLETVTFLEMAYFLEILSLVPNAEQLAIDSLRVLHAGKDQPQTSKNEFLNLKYLNILELYDCDEVCEVVFNKLPVGVLREFTCSGRRIGCNLKSLESLFSWQTNIKKLSLIQWNSTNGRVQLPSHILDNLELELLEMRNIDIETAALSRQTKLKSLKTDGGHVVMKVVANNLTDLEELEWQVADITLVNDFENISRLKNLKRLNLDGVERTDILNKLIQLDNSRIATLEIENFYVVEVHQIQLLAKSAPNLKVLKLTRGLYWDRITDVLNNFNFIESLTLGNGTNGGSYETYINQNDSVNAKLTELNFETEFKTPIIRKMIADFPNLKKLTILTDTDLTSSNFQLILNGFTKLESLVFRSLMLLTFDDFKYLRDHRNRFEFLIMSGMDDLFIDQNLEGLVDQHLEDLEAMFEVVKYWSRIGLRIKM